MNHYKFSFETYDRDYQTRVLEVTVTVIALDEEEALEKAKKLVTREYYQLFKVEED